MIRTLIVEDDFRVGRLAAEMVSQVPGFTVVEVAHTASAALDAAESTQPHLVLLDLYLPDLHGLELLRRLRAAQAPPDVIVLSAARDMASVRTAMQHGAMHYLIKPYDFDDLRARLDAYAELSAARADERDTEQQEVDRLFGLVGQPLHTGAGALPKGFSEVTAELVRDALRAAREPASASTIAECVGISRTTAQRYLTTLADSGEIRLRLRYGTAGRPEHVYELPREG